MGVGGSGCLQEQRGQQIHAVLSGDRTVHLRIEPVDGGLQLLDGSSRKWLRQNGEGSGDDPRGSRGKAGLNVTGGAVPERKPVPDAGADPPDVADR